MSASPSKARLTIVPDDRLEQAKHGGPVLPASPEAFQALLAFSAFHQQIRQRPAAGEGTSDPSSREDTLQLERFVLDEVLQLVAERGLAITGADGVAIAMAEGNAIVCRGACGAVSPDIGARLDPNSGFSGACLVSGRIVRCDDSELDSRVDAHTCRRLGARSMVAVPLSARQRVIGLIEAFSSEPYGFNDSDVRSLSLLGELLLAALRPEEEDRLAEISQRVVGAGLPAAQAPISASRLDSRRRASDAPEMAETAASTRPTAGPVEAPVAETIPGPTGSPLGLEATRPGLGIVAVIVLAAAGFGGVFLWSLRPHQNAPPQGISTGSPVTAAPKTTPQQSTPEPAISAPPPDSSSSFSGVSAEKTGGLSRVTGIRQWSTADSNTVVIDLDDQVQYEAHRLSNPERIYLDLHDTNLAAQLSGKTIEVGDALLSRIRIAQPTPGVTRIVLETRSAADFSVSLEQNPYRLSVQVHKPGSKPASKSSLDLFGPVRNDSLQPGQASLANAGNARASFATNAHRMAAQPLTRIALDAGHGGWDLGTVGRHGLLEKDLVLDIVGRLGKLLENRLGAEVIYTRADDDYVPLEKRAEIANLSRADLLVSVHANYSDYPSARGVETYYTDTYSSVRARMPEAETGSAALQNVSWTNVDIREKVHESRHLAASVQRSLYEMLAAKNSGIRNRGVKEAQYVVLTGSMMPAILAEVSFVSSPTDENALQNESYRQQIAEALYNGIVRYIQQAEHAKVASVASRTALR